MCCNGNRVNGAVMVTGSTVLYTSLCVCVCRAEERFASLRENQEAKLTVEKSRTQVLKVKHQNLQETYKIKVRSHWIFGSWYAKVPIRVTMTINH